MAFAALGTIVFELHGAPNTLRATHGEDYAAQKVVGRKPVLQAVGAKLKTYALELGFHASFTDPRAALAALEAAMRARQALPFVLGDGTHLGRYVIESLTVEPRASFVDGRMIGVRVNAALTEYVADDLPARRRKPAPGFTPPAKVAPAPGATPAAPTFNPAAPANPRNLMPPDAAARLTKSGALAPGASPLLARGTSGALGPLAPANLVPPNEAVRAPV